MNRLMYKLDEPVEISQEEFDLLKEWLENE